MVAGLHTWNRSFKRFVNKGEEGIVILVPTPYQRDVKKPDLDADGIKQLFNIFPFDIPFLMNFFTGCVNVRKRKHLVLLSVFIFCCRDIIFFHFRIDNSHKIV